MFIIVNGYKLTKEIKRMVDAIADLNASVDSLTAEVALATAALDAIPKDDTAAIEAAVARIDAAKAALAAHDGSTPATPAP